MASKDFLLDNGLAVTVYKRKTSRNLRLSISPTGKIRVSIPSWATYGTGLAFAKSRSDWIRSQQKNPLILQHGQAVGKAHHLQFVAKPETIKVTSRVKGSLVIISHSDLDDPRIAEIQIEAEKGCIRALRAQAEQLLPQRLAELSSSHGFQYKSVSIKKLKSRWGSCDQDNNIVLNLFLMQLPWELIDYVLMHELTHTVVHKHGPSFWQAMESKLPNVSYIRKSIRNQVPVLQGTIVS